MSRKNAKQITSLQLRQHSQASFFEQDDTENLGKVQSIISDQVLSLLSPVLQQIADSQASANLEIVKLRGTMEKVMDGVQTELSNFQCKCREDFDRLHENFENQVSTIVSNVADVLKGVRDDIQSELTILDDKMLKIPDKTTNDTISSESSLKKLPFVTITMDGFTHTLDLSARDREKLLSSQVLRTTIRQTLEFVHPIEELRNYTVTGVGGKKRPAEAERESEIDSRAPLPRKTLEFIYAVCEKVHPPIVAADRSMQQIILDRSRADIRVQCGKALNYYRTDYCVNEKNEIVKIRKKAQQK